MNSLEEVFKDQSKTIKKQLSFSKGVLLLVGMNDSPFDKVLWSFSDFLIKQSQSIVAFERSRGKWSITDVVINWHKDIKTYYLSSTLKNSLFQEIQSLSQDHFFYFIFDQIIDKETAKTIFKL